MKSKFMSKHVAFLISLVILLNFSVKRVEAATFYIHHDHNGNTSLVTSNGSVVSRSSYFPFGEDRTDLGLRPTELGFASQYSDEKETNLYYFKARYYYPAIGRFTQADTLRDGENRYSYVGNNPVNKTDPSGFCDPENWLCKLWNFPSTRTGVVVFDYIFNPPAVNENLPSVPPPATFNPDVEPVSCVGVSCTGNGGSQTANPISLSEVLGGKAQNQFDSEVGWLIADPRDTVAENILNPVATDIMKKTGTDQVMAKTAWATVWIMTNYSYDSTLRGQPYAAGGGSATLGNVLIGSSMVCNENSAVLHILLGKMGISSQLVDIVLPGDFGHLGVRVYDPTTKKYYYVDPSFGKIYDWEAWLKWMEGMRADVNLRDTLNDYPVEEPDPVSYSDNATEIY